MTKTTRSIVGRHSPKLGLRRLARASAVGLLLGAGLLSAAGCGQKGPLTLPTAAALATATTA